MNGFGGFGSLFCLSPGSLRRSGSEAMFRCDNSSCSLCVVRQWMVLQCGVDVVGVDGVVVGLRRKLGGMV